MKTLSLNISERLSAVTILNGFKGNLDRLAIILEDIKGFPITEEEWTKAERVIEIPVVLIANGEIQNIDEKKFDPETMRKGNGDTNWKWQDDKGGDKEITVQPATVDYLKTFIKESDEKGEFTLKDRAFITLLAKLNK